MKPVISIIMGSKSDWATMQKTAEVLDNFGVAYEKKVVSENLIAMKRAGADIIITYHALDAAKWIDEFYK